MSFWYLQFSQKMNEKNRLYYYGSSSSRIVFVRFLGELKTTKRHFEINWPLLWYLKSNCFRSFFGRKTKKIFRNLVEEGGSKLVANGGTSFVIISSLPFNEFPLTDICSPFTHLVPVVTAITSISSIESPKYIKRK